MMQVVNIDKRLRLFTPGPINTSDRVRSAMMFDWGSRTPEFADLTARVRNALLQVGNAGDGYTAVLLQGSGSFAVEAMITTLVPQAARILVLSNGTYGDRIAHTCSIHRIDHVVKRFPECTPIVAEEIEKTLRSEGGFSYIAVVHCETSSGILNPLPDILRLAERYRCQVLVDAMSTFGAVPIDYSAPAMTAVAASANKCLHGVPGVSFVIVRKERLASAGPARTLCLDLRAQVEEFERSGQWRYTPPTHVLAALDAALAEWLERGGAVRRLQAYRARCARLIAGMTRLGYEPMVPEQYQAPMIVAFRPADGTPFDFATVYRQLAARGLSIYPSKIAHANGFRIGCIGEIAEHDIDELLGAFAELGQRCAEPALATV